MVLLNNGCLVVITSSEPNRMALYLLGLLFRLRYVRLVLFFIILSVGV